MIALCVCSGAHARQVVIGEINFSGSFTTNHLYNYNNPASQPYGWFSSPQTVSNVSGTFAPSVQVGDVLAMNTPFVFGPITSVDHLVSSPMIWTIGSFTFDWETILITGPMSHESVGGGLFDVATNPWTYWEFTAPPHDFGDPDITGPITLNIITRFEDGHVPETGTTLLLFGLALGVLYLALRFSSNWHINDVAPVALYR